jgi:hypothetical protein
MAQPFVLRERWFDVSVLEFEAFLRDYPRPVETRPSLPQKANYRERVDPSIGVRPGNAVGKSWERLGCLGYQIRLDLVLKVSAQERRSCLWWIELIRPSVGRGGASSQLAPERQ